MNFETEIDFTKARLAHYMLTVIVEQYESMIEAGEALEMNPFVLIKMVNRYHAYSLESFFSVLHKLGQDISILSDETISTITNAHTLAELKREAEEAEMFELAEA
jgi:hypothetical protein